MALVSDGAQYADNIISASIPACRWVRLACERFLSDLERQGNEDFPYIFDSEAAQDILDFCGMCKHSKGIWAGQVFEPEPWQVLILINLFGWVHKLTGLRRFKTAYLEVGRKNGKSTLLAVIGLFMLAADGEPGAEVYSAATKREQAKIVFSEATRMVRSSPDLRRHINCFQNNMHILSSASKFEPLGADANNLDGLNSHCNLIDELHAHKTRNLWDVLETGTGARTQSMQIAITTAGFNQNGICFEQRDYLLKILQSVIDDSSYFGIIYTIDYEDQDGDGDDWRDESIWKKANPNWGVSVFPDDIRRLAQKAMELPAAQNNFKMKRLSVWTQQETRWIDVHAWNASDHLFKTEALEGNPCYGGLDLSSKLDLSCFALSFPPFEDRAFWAFLFEFWIPKDNIMARVRRDKVPFDAWARDGHITATPGNVVDYNYIQKQINHAADIYDIQDIGYDPDNATMLVQALQDEDGITMVEFRQGIRSYSEPSKEFEALIKSKAIAHNGHPVMRWCISNVAIKSNAQDNYMPAKDKSTDRIDGVVASIMALGRAIRCETEDYIDADGISVV